MVRHGQFAYGFSGILTLIDMVVQFTDAWAKIVESIGGY